MPPKPGIGISTSGTAKSRMKNKAGEVALRAWQYAQMTIIATVKKAKLPSRNAAMVAASHALRQAANSLAEVKGPHSWRIIRKAGSAAIRTAMSGLIFCVTDFPAPGETR